MFKNKNLVFILIRAWSSHTSAFYTLQWWYQHCLCRQGSKYWQETGPNHSPSQCMTSITGHDELDSAPHSSTDFFRGLGVRKVRKHSHSKGSPFFLSWDADLSEKGVKGMNTKVKHRLRSGTVSACFGQQRMNQRPIKKAPVIKNSQQTLTSANTFILHSRVAQMTALVRLRCQLSICPMYWNHLQDIVTKANCCQEYCKCAVGEIQLSSERYTHNTLTHNTTIVTHSTHCATQKDGWRNEWSLQQMLKETHRHRVAPHVLLNIPESPPRVSPTSPSAPQLCCIFMSFSREWNEHCWNAVHVGSA